ncbi:hypothetical protein B296_00009353 [Ensete ventricosum]|uniref:Uncharacterized protein n=1 Tax=Ensete ventricosum TaxID=4639 RepID=A0A427AXM8_ENSVE|nr:hypothetical protein B296_00009353 [Ensete ventricosum]
MKNSNPCLTPLILAHHSLPPLILVLCGHQSLHRLMPVTHQRKKDSNISDLETYAMASEDLIDAKLEAFEMRMEKKLRAPSWNPD